MIEPENEGIRYLGADFFHETYAKAIAENPESIEDVRVLARAVNFLMKEQQRQGTEAIERESWIRNLENQVDDLNDALKRLNTGERAD